jgi:hypothetical protein
LVALNELFPPKPVNEITSQIRAIAFKTGTTQLKNTLMPNDACSAEPNVK